MFKASRHSIIFSLLLILTGCAGYYEKNLMLMQAFERKDFNQAENILDNKKLEKQKRNLLLYYLNKGAVLHMGGKYKESNEYLQKADYFIEDFHTNYGLAAASLLTNPSVRPYEGENHEKILLHYYSTLNYLQLNDLDEALVECKRMLLTMQHISDYYQGNNKYKRDAFTHLLLGLIYDAQNDVNNAFIAYRNAYEVYQNDYAKNLGTEPPLQLKKDLLRTAYQNGFYSELDIFEKEFGMKYDPKEKTTSDMVCFWNKDLCPIKIPYSIDFLITDMGNGYLLFTNLELGYSIPIYIGDKSADKDKIIKMKIIRVAIPKLESRKPKYINASIENGNTIYPFELTENIDAIAFLSLKDRMEKELAETLLRFSLKRITEMEARKESVWIGIAVNIFNAMTEQADTRIWQMLPQSINYTRVNLMEGENNYTFHLKGYNSTTTDSICIESKTKTTYFKTFVNY
jgi:hypothetical protein